MAVIADRTDKHSFANPSQMQVKHVDLNLALDFDKRVLSGSAILTVDRAINYREGPIVLDSRGLDVKRAECSVDLATFRDCKWSFGKTDPILGAPLTIFAEPDTKFIRIEYATRPDSHGLQWLTPAQTAGKKTPFMFSQSQAIHARSWVPLQDSPAIRITYSAKVKTPEGLVAVMSAENDSNAPKTGEYSFRMAQTIPSYLMAIAAGDLSFRPIGKRTGVWGEPGIVDKAAHEFDDAERMIQAAEQLYGPYQWGRYDILVLPPSFPFGGMENPRLTFVTPALLAGDKSLVETVAHEIAHSWSGNLVSNATWRDFWLNEGITTYITLRIQERVFGPDRSDMEAVLARGELEELLRTLPPKDQVLHIDLAGRDPDDGMNDVPYVKGMLFLRTLEETFGRDRFDPVLRSYFQRFAFQSITTADFLEFLRTNLFEAYPDVGKNISIAEWITKPGLPASAPKPAARAFTRVDDVAQKYSAGSIASSAVPWSQWGTQERLRFLRSLPEKLDAGRMAELDRTLNLTSSGNAEVAMQWLLMAVRNGYQPAYGRLEQFLTTIGRRKYLKPLYEELAKSADGRAKAVTIYAKARPGYHPISAATVDGVLKAQPEGTSGK